MNLSPTQCKKYSAIIFMRHSPMYRKPYKRDSNTFEKPIAALSKFDLEKTYSNMTEDALYQQKHYLESLKNKSNATYERLDFIKKLIARAKVEREALD